MNATQQIKNIQIKPAVPPLTRPMLETLQLQNESQFLLTTHTIRITNLIMLSHDAMRIIVKPNMEIKRKFLCTSSTSAITREHNWNYKPSAPASFPSGTYWLGHRRCQSSHRRHCRHRVPVGGSIQQNHCRPGCQSSQLKPC